ncbi:MAG: ChaN family lipoprotein [Reichenbachiella sp.]|uniref:ChaN family lipoprotein n=1 Tax=Reichenbachiella sp. TaxID=2184521 RepID=UPI00329795F1
MRKIKFVILFLTLTLSISGFTQDKPAYRLFNNSGKAAKYNKMIQDLSNSDMVFFGEYHTNPISHWLQLEVSKSLYEIRGKDLFFGAEMFESGNQLVLDEYLKGFYPEDKMLPEMTQLWGNFQTDYKPLLEYAKENQLRFIATNIPRRYASIINKNGIESLEKLSPEARALISPDLQKYFDPSVKAYAEIAQYMGEHVPPNILNIQMAQASKDATMAYFSLKNFNEGDLLLHFQGTYHSNYDQGIIWWINKIRPGLIIKSITTVMQSEWDELNKEEKETIADYIIVVDDNMTQTKRD